jgi:hypothetical protein
MILRRDPIHRYGVFFPRRRKIVRRPLENPRAALALIFRPCLCVMAKRLAQLESFFKRSHKVIVALTVQEILDEHIAKKLV